MPLSIDWSRVGPPRPESRPVPPVSMRLNGYVIDFATSLGQIMYVCGTGYDGFGEAWTFDGERWEPLAATTKIRLEGEGPYLGYWDPKREAMVIHRFDYDSDSETQRPQTMLVDGKGTRRLSTSGAFPIAGEDGDVGGAFGYDRVRELGVCLTPHGLWTLDAAGVWTKTAISTAKVPKEWKNDAGAVWDPVRERLFSWIYEGDDYTHVFYEWDGASLTRASIDGLPCTKGKLRTFHIGLFNPSAAFVGHPRHGVILHDGPRQFAFDGQRWHELPTSQTPPPRMEGGRLAHDPIRDTIVLGPGYHEGDSGGREAQQVFFAQQDGRWSMQGVVASDSPIAQASRRLYFTCKGESFAASVRELWTWAWRDNQWIETFSEASGDALIGGDWIDQIVEMGDHALAISRTGKLHRFDGSSWTNTGESIPDFADRRDFVAVRQGEGDDLLLWGGEIKNRKSNDTFLRTGGVWHKPKKASPRPADFGGIYVDFQAIWDAGLQRVVRFGYDEVATFEGELWQAHAPKHYTKQIGSRRSEHLPAHDPKTGETLLINLREGTVLRFDLEQCTLVAEFELPGELDPVEQHDTPAWARIRDDIWYDPIARTLEAQHVEDRYGRYCWALRPAFEAAAALGPRTTLAAAAAPTPAAPKSEPKPKPGVSARLYLIDGAKQSQWICASEGTDVLIRSGKLGEPLVDKRVSKKTAAAAREHADKQIAAKRAQGYVPAAKLDQHALAAMVAVESRALTIGKPRKRPPVDPSIDRIGGLPSGVAAKDWPTIDDRPAGFLVQLATEGLLRKYAGVAVFCATDGSATEDEDQNAVVLLTPAKWAKEPLAEAPDSVVPLAVRPLARAKPKLEIVESRVDTIAADDPDLAAAIERFARSKRVHEDLPWSKIGGQPHWVQGGEIGDDWILIAQLDFDGLRLDEWPDAGLFGVLYILVSRDERQAVAMWQYT